MHCPYCGGPVSPGAAQCPRCRADDLTVWPPPPARVDEAVPYEPERSGPGEGAQGFSVGCVSQLAVWCLVALSPFGLFLSQLGEQPAAFHALTFACALAVGGFCALSMRHHAPSFARGIGASMAVTVACLCAALRYWN